MAVQSPKVDTLAKSMAGLDPAFKEQKGLIQEQIGGLDAKYDIEKQAMEGTRVQAFESINRSMVGRGAAFSGIGADEQSRYLANSYLPGLQRIDQAKRDESLSLRKNIADLGMQQTTMAMSRIQQQEQALNQWNLSQAQIQAQSREAALNRQFQAKEGALDRSHSAGIAAMNRSAPVQSSNSARAAAQSVIDDAFKQSGKGDGKVSPSVFNKAMNAFLDKGGSPSDFRDVFGTYANDSHLGSYGIFK